MRNYLFEPQLIQSQSPPPFTFRARDSGIDWSRIKRTNVDRIASEVDVPSLESLLLNITFGRLTFDEVEQVDVLTLIKLVRLYQLIIEYLLYSQDYYRMQISTHENRVKEFYEKYLEAEEKNKTMKADLKAQKKDLDETKKLYEATQGSMKDLECKFCKGKVFINAQYLHAHYLRRHKNLLRTIPDHATEAPIVQPAPSPTSYQIVPVRAAFTSRPVIPPELVREYIEPPLTVHDYGMESLYNRYTPAATSSRVHRSNMKDLRELEDAVGDIQNKVEAINLTRINPELLSSQRNGAKAHRREPTLKTQTQSIEVYKPTPKASIRIVSEEAMPNETPAAYEGYIEAEPQLLLSKKEQRVMSLHRSYSKDRDNKFVGESGITSRSFYPLEKPGKSQYEMNLGLKQEVERFRKRYDLKNDAQSKEKVNALNLPRDVAGNVNIILTELDHEA